MRIPTERLFELARLFTAAVHDHVETDEVRAMASELLAYREAVGLLRSLVGGADPVRWSPLPDETGPIVAPGVDTRAWWKRGCRHPESPI